MTTNNNDKYYKGVRKLCEEETDDFSTWDADVKIKLRTSKHQKYRSSMTILSEDPPIITISEKEYNEPEFWEDAQTAAAGIILSSWMTSWS